MMAIKRVHSSYQRCPSPEPYSSYNELPSSQPMARQYATSTRLLLGLSWVLTLVSIIAVIIINVAGTHVNSHSQQDQVSSGTVDLDSLTILTFYYYSTTGASTTFSWYPNSLIAHNASSAPTRIWTGPGSSPGTALSSYLVSSHQQSSSIALDFTWSSNAGPFALQILAVTAALVPLVLLPFLVFRSGNRESRIRHRDIEIWTCALGVISAGVAAIGAALLTWRACQMQTQLYQAYGVVMVGRIGRLMLTCLWLAPTTMGIGAVIVLLVLVYMGRGDVVPYERPEASAESGWYRRGRVEEMDAPPPYELLNRPYGQRK